MLHCVAMQNQKPPTTLDICANCPSPALVAKPKNHFGQPAWDFECNYAMEVFIESGGIVINCSNSDQRCCVDDGVEYFVNSPKISPLKNFFEASIKFLNR